MYSIKLQKNFYCPFLWKSRHPHWSRLGYIICFDQGNVGENDMCLSSRGSSLFLFPLLWDYYNLLAFSICPEIQLKPTHDEHVRIKKETFVVVRHWDFEDVFYCSKTSPPLTNACCYMTDTWLVSGASLVAQTIKNPPAVPGLRRSPGKGNGYPLEYSY